MIKNAIYINKDDLTHFDDVELGQQVAVGQSELLTVQEGAGGGSDIISAVLVDLVRQRRAQVVIQLLQGLQQTLLQICTSKRFIQRRLNKNPQNDLTGAISFSCDDFLFE